MLHRAAQASCRAGRLSSNVRPQNKHPPLVPQQTAEITQTLVRALLADQFPEWAGLPVSPVQQSGWDNRTFTLGNDMLVRMPSAAAYAAQVDREQRWLPYLRARLPLEIPEPLALGQPGRGYLWPWSVYRWIVGDTAAASPPMDTARFAKDLAEFIRALHCASANHGPVPGEDNFYRGGSLAVYDGQFRQAVGILGEEGGGANALAIWQAALASSWAAPPVWVHGDIALGNLLVRDGRLAAVIDFGQLCVGDPACDLAIAWTYLQAKDREIFRQHLALDLGTWHRGKAWALWKAAIVASGLVCSNAIEGKSARNTMNQILSDAQRAEA